ncbi:hypothetical protein AB0M11_20405 [Streptomyces sp. NPDC051987]|uniref:hypothetical protein n=1 Tax=Streptomyces sp. NPDC051987 TaxID=3155808 RepID=UPI003425E9C0
MSPRWFELEEPDDHLDLDITGPERAFVEALRSHTAQWPSEGGGGEISRPDAEDALLAYITLSDPESRLSLIDVGVHLSGDRIRGDRLHNQLFTLPDRPSAWALNAEGSPQELARRTAEWMRTALLRPVVLYVWLHDGYAYAARYAFADRDETLNQLYNRRYAPDGQAEALTAAGHVHGRGWIQTTGLPTPDLYLHIRGDLDQAALPSGTRATTHRGTIAGVWYE